MTEPLHKALDRFSETEIDDEVVVMQLDSGVFFSLTGTARRIWELIDGTRNRDEVLAILVTEFGGDQRIVATETDGFIAELRAAGLIVPA